MEIGEANFADYGITLAVTVSSKCNLTDAAA